jgi:hypothetical protein
MVLGVLASLGLESAGRARITKANEGARVTHYVLQHGADFGI